MKVIDILSDKPDDVLRRWFDTHDHSKLVSATIQHSARLDARCKRLLEALRDNLPRIDQADPESDAFGAIYAATLEIDAELAGSGGRTGEEAYFILALKTTLVDMLGEAHTGDNKPLIDEVRWLSGLLDVVMLKYTERQADRQQDRIAAQARELVEMSVPIITLWDGIIVLPIIGTLDSYRAQTLMESLLGGR